MPTVPQGSCSAVLWILEWFGVLFICYLTPSECGGSWTVLFLFALVVSVPTRMLGT